MARRGGVENGGSSQVAHDPGPQARSDFFDAANAEEMFLTSTSLCIGAVRSYDASIVLDTVVANPLNAARLVYGTLPRAIRVGGRFFDKHHMVLNLK